MNPLLLWHNHQITERYRSVDSFIEGHIDNILHNHYGVFVVAEFVYTYSVERFNDLFKARKYTFKNGYAVNQHRINTDFGTEISYNAIFKHDDYIVMINTNANLSGNEAGVKSIRKLTENACKMFLQWKCDYEF